MPASADSPAPPRALVVSLHDVSPQTWSACAQILRELEEMGVAHVSLLVIPNHHFLGAIGADAEFVDWLRAQTAAGHEAVIHGYHHLRRRRVQESLKDRLTTRLYTADEGEFYDLEREPAHESVARARGEFAALGIHSSGFIAPAWLLSRPAEEALRELGIAYTTRLSNVQDLASGTIYRSQSLVWSVRSAWRRWISLIWNACLFHQLRARPLLRISIHPVDLRHRRIWQQIRRLIKRALADREALTYERWLSRQRATSSV